MYFREVRTSPDSWLMVHGSNQHKVAKRVTCGGTEHCLVLKKVYMLVE